MDMNKDYLLGDYVYVANNDTIVARIIKVHDVQRTRGFEKCYIIKIIEEGEHYGKIFETNGAMLFSTCNRHIMSKILATL